MSRSAALGAVFIIAASGAGCDWPASSPVEGAKSGTWRVSERGAGPVVAGMLLADAEKAAGLALTTPGATECGYATAPAAPDGLMFMVVDGRVARVDVTAPGVPTESGIVVGDTDDRVREVYGERVTSSPHKYTVGRYLTVAPDAGHRLVFETDGQHVTRYRGGRTPEVEWVEGCS